MKVMRLFAGVAIGVSFAVASAAWAEQAYPSQPIKLIIPYPPGGGIDPAGRILALALSEELGTPVVVHNAGGASGQIGTALVAKAPADGYTLLFASAAPNAILPAARPNLPYTNKEFAPISSIGSTDYVLVGNSAVPGNDIKELLQTIRTQPDKVGAFASSGQLSGPHLAGELFKILSKGQMQHVPYRGNGPAMTAILAGEVPIMFATAPAVMPHVQAGRLKVFGVSGKSRSALLPDVPALADSMPGLEVSQWYGLMAPAGTPSVVIEKLHDATVKVLALEKVRTQFMTHGIEPKSSSSADFGKFIESETLKYKSVIKKADIQAE